MVTRIRRVFSGVRKAILPETAFIQHKWWLKSKKLPGVTIADGFAMAFPYYVTFNSEDFILTIDKNVQFRAFCNLLIYEKASLVIGANVFFNNYCSINCLGNIEIGQGTIFGESVKIYDHNHAYQFADDALSIEKERFTIGRVKIGKNCWIGTGVTILNNVEIGDNVIIGAHCLIYKSVESNSVVKHDESLTINKR